jgi:hypothetical protein
MKIEGKKIAVYKVETSFNITGRGILALCQKLDGIIKLGSTTILNIDSINVPARIIGADWEKPGTDGILRCGLLLSFDDNAITEKVAKEKLKEQIIEVFYGE